MIICSLHQPSFEILDMLDNIIVLDNGQTVYNVAEPHQGSASSIISRLTTIKPFQFPEDISPVDYLLYLVNSRKTPDAAENVKLFVLESKRFNETRSALSLLDGKLPQDQASPDKEKELDLLRRPAPKARNRFRVGACKKFTLLLQRGFNNLIQHKKLFVIFNLQMILIMLVTLGVYARMRRDYEKVDPEHPKNEDIQDRIASFFFIAINFYCCILLNSSFSMEEEAQIIYKEISGGMYGYGAYFWSKTFVDWVLLLPPVFVQIYLVACTDQYYYFLHMDQTWTMFLIFGEMVLWNSILGNSFGVLLGSMVRGIKTIVQLITIFFVPFAIMAGFIVNTCRPLSSANLGFFSFMKYLSPMKYSLEIPLQEEFKDSPQGQFVIGLFDYGYGVDKCRYILAAYLVGSRLLGYLSFVWQTSRFV